MNASAVPEPRRGWGLKKIIVAVVIAVVAILGGLFVVGLVTPVETLVAVAAEERNVHKGAQIDSVTRFDEAVADGAVLVLRYTLLDGWYDTLVEEMAEEIEQALGRAPDREGALSLIEGGTLDDACEERTALGKPEARVRVEYRDARGASLFTVEARASTC